MKTLKLFATIALLGFLSCTHLIQDQNVENVKSSTLNLVGASYIIGDIVNEITGFKGSVKWYSFIPEGYQDKNVYVVQADIIRDTEDRNIVKIQFLFNKNTGLVKIYHISFDGVNKSKIDLYSLLMSLGAAK